MISLPVLAALGFASYRATQLIVHDSILDGLRQRLELWHARKFDSRARSFVRDLVSCVYCSGWWMSLASVLVYLTATDGWAGTPLLVHAVECWTVAGIQALLNRLDDSLPVRGH